MNAPIGVFDSGLGGLTVLKALRDALPHESFVYLGDVARLPYGNKSVTVVNSYAHGCTRFLEQSHVKLVVIACNTATALSLQSLQQDFTLPIVGVIEGGVQSVLASGQARNVLVLATDSTVRNEAYLREFNRRGFEGQVRQVACPLLVPLAEEGWWDHSVTVEVIQSYLAAESIKGFEFDTVVLGCTHYPLLEPSFRKAVSHQVRLVHGGGPVADQVRGILEQKDLLAKPGGTTSVNFFSTDTVSSNLPLLKYCESLGRIEFQLASLN